MLFLTVFQLYHLTPLLCQTHLCLEKQLSLLATTALTCRYKAWQTSFQLFLLRLVVDSSLFHPQAQIPDLDLLSLLIRRALHLRASHLLYNGKLQL